MNATPEVLPPKPRSRDVRRWLGVSDVWIWRHRRDGSFPQPVQLGSRTLFWDRDELLAWWAARREAKP